MTFRELEVELDPKEGGENSPPEPSIVDVETWLDWQACQLDMPCWWTELAAIPEMEDPQKLTQKIWASFLIPEVRSRVFLGQDYAQWLQYCAEKLNLPESPDFHSLARIVIELRERVNEHVMFTKWDIIWGVGWVNPGATSQ